MVYKGVDQEYCISIHALREEGDPDRFFQSGGELISIHALREEGDTAGMQPPVCMIHFYPRPPRGGRRRSPRPPAPPANFYPRPPRGGRPGHDRHR